jgi:tetratricopeptide (TPR) repeat protein
MIDRGLALALALSVLSALCWGQESVVANPLESALAAASEGRFEDAIALLEALEDPAANPREMALLGALYAETGRSAEALEVLQPLAEQAEVDPAVLYNAGRSALAVGRVELAEGYLERSLGLSPGSPAGRELGLLRGQQGRCRDAYALLVPWARANPQDTEARLVGALCGLELQRFPTVEELLSDLPQEDPRVRLLWGRLLMLKGDPWGAIATLEPLMDVAPPAMELDARRTLAEAYTMAGKAERSVQLLAGRIEGNPKAAFQLAEAQYQSGDLIGAVTTIEPFAKSILESEEAPGSAVPSSMVPHILLFYGRVLSASRKRCQRWNRPASWTRTTSRSGRPWGRRWRRSAEPRKHRKRSLGFAKWRHKRPASPRRRWRKINGIRRAETWVGDSNY